MGNFKNWLKENTHPTTHFHHEKLGSPIDMYGPDIHDAEIPIVHLLVPVIKEVSQGRKKVELFDELMEALPVAFSYAFPEIKNLPIIYGPTSLRDLREELRKFDEKEGPTSPNNDEWKHYY